MTKRGEDLDLAKLAARALSAEEPGLPQSLDDRASNIAALESALRSRARRRWLRPRAAVAAVLAVAAAGVFLVWIEPASRTPQRPPVAAEKAAPPRPLASVEFVSGPMLVGGVERGLVADEDLAPGTTLGVPQEGRLALRLRTGTRLGLAGGTSARVAELGAVTRFDLEDGTFTAEVTKLVAGQRFLIATPDTEVEVKGTRFVVVVTPTPSTCDPRTRTSVRVDEGVVAVRFGGTELRVPAGQQWPACDRSASGTPPAEHPHNRQRPRRALTHAATQVSSTLAEQNDLFAAALTAKRRGELEEAQRWLDQLLSRYPNGQLAASARAEQRRVGELRGQSGTDP